MTFEISSEFERCKKFETRFPVYKITNSDDSCIHRFYDTSPISPSGKYIALCRFSRENTLPRFGEVAKVVVYDLSVGNEIYISETQAWDTQLGAQVQWGATDHELFFNRIDTETLEPFGVMVDVLNANEMALKNTIYMVSPCGGYAITPCLNRISNVQAGYGILLPGTVIKKNRGAVSDDGLYLIDIKENKSSLLISFSDIYKSLKSTFSDIDLNSGGFYGFHTKWSPSGDKILFLIRWLEDGKRKTKNYLLSMNANGSNLKVVVDAHRWVGGHHPNWHPNGEEIIMNLMFNNDYHKFGVVTELIEKISRKLGFRYFSNSKFLRFARIKSDGSKIEVFNEKSFGSGHPSFHPKHDFLVTDCYPSERVAHHNRTIPIRFVTPNDERTVCVLETVPYYNKRSVAMRIDPHPAWDAQGRFIVVNALNGRNRGVFIIDTKEEVYNA
ncbi:hypothetical protein CSW98_02650 [Vibrio sp. HA2012]|uniref:hypothetical protein n=1 Tax=Vibrio sp. HA2012 TaxID=1971595 RepID=UPI000C2B84EA|nr:hypothetical protein [Vibrio sp. HA2012]PJC88037.1 hypothetical protein CSW98_02650 [Vibrio sp. HA2012]